MKKYRIDKLKCAGCGVCVNFCPFNAIKINKDGKAEIDEKKCKKCGKCINSCPFNAIKYE